MSKMTANPFKSGKTNNLKYHNISIFKKNPIEFTNINIKQLLRSTANVYWKNTEGYYLGCNDAQAEFLQLRSRKDFIGTTLSDYLIQEDLNIFTHTDNTVMRSG